MTPSAMPAARGAPAPTPAQLEDFRAQLYEQVRFRTDQLRYLRTGSELRAAGSREISDSLVVAARAALRELTDALRRLAAGSYGWCTACGERLPLERLEVVPQVALCLPCQRQVELGAATLAERP